MKTLVIYLNKGGAGKSMLTSQLAFYASQIVGLSVLVVDIDDQSNSTQLFKRSEIASVFPQTFTQILESGVKSWQPNHETPLLCVVPSDTLSASKIVQRAAVQVNVEGQVIEKSQLAYENFDDFLKAVDPHFDLCIVDSPSSNDIRVWIALGRADYVMSPIKLAQEYLDGMMTTLAGPQGILNIQKSVNDELNFLGFLPNEVETSKRQREALEMIANSVGKYLFRDSDGRIMSIPKRSSIVDAQGSGVSLADMASENSHVQAAWQSVRKVLDEILKKMGFGKDVEASEEIRQQKIAEQRMESLKLAQIKNRKAEVANEAAQ